MYVSEVRCFMVVLYGGALWWCFMVVLYGGIAPIEIVCNMSLTLIPWRLIWYLNGHSKHTKTSALKIKTMMSQFIFVQFVNVCL